MVAALLVAIGLGVVATVAVPDLSPRTLSVPGSESERARTALADELGYDPVPAVRLVLTAPEGFGDPASEVAVATLLDSTRSVDGVAAVVEGPRSEDGMTTTLRVHFPIDTEPDEISAAVAELRATLDPGLLELAIAGPVPVAVELRDQLTADALELSVLVVPLAILLLVAVAGLRFGLLAFFCGALGAVLALGGALLATELLDASPAAVVAAALCGLVVAAETSLGLILRYREEGAELGAGGEAIEYSIAASARGLWLGSVAVIGTGVALTLTRVDPISSIGLGVVVAGLAAGPAALVVTAAALALGVGEPAGSPMPMVPADDPPREASRPFRALVVLAGSRLRALAVVAVCAAALLFASAEIDRLGAVGTSAAELEASEIGAAEEALAGAYGRGASAPIFIAVDGPPEAPTTTIYRDAISRLDGVESVAGGTMAGEGALIEVIPSGRALSPAAQRTVEAVRGLPDAPVEARVFGRPAALVDARERLEGSLPLAGLLVLLASAALATAVLRAPYAPLLVLVAAAPALAALGLLQLVFGQGALTGPLGYEPLGAPHPGGTVLVGVALLAIGLYRSLWFAAALDGERDLGAAARGALARAGAITIGPAIAVGIVAAVFAGAWIGSDLVVAKEVGFGLAVGLLADSLVVRPLLGPALARLAIPR
ncbi:MAG: hypothetical protein ACR2K6_04435 [Solirubrobacterales bacterium]